MCMCLHVPACVPCVDALLVFSSYSTCFLSDSFVFVMCVVCCGLSEQIYLGATKTKCPSALAKCPMRYALAPKFTRRVL